MPRFYFHLTGATTIQDDEGGHCGSLEIAHVYAEQIAKELGRHKPAAYLREHWVRVTDENGREVFRTPLVNDL